MVEFWLESLLASVVLVLKFLNFYSYNSDPKDSANHLPNLDWNDLEFNQYLHDNLKRYVNNQLLNHLYFDFFFQKQPDLKTSDLHQKQFHNQPVFFLAFSIWIFILKIFESRFCSFISPCMFNLPFLENPLFSSFVKSVIS